MGQETAPSLSEPLTEDLERRYLQAARSGDLSAFEGLMALYWPRIESLVRRLLAHPQDVEDAMQETFLNAYEGLHRFRGDSGLYTWFARIAINVCRNKRRGAWFRRVRLHGDDLPETLSGVDVPRIVEGTFRREELERALNALPEKYFLPLVLYFYEEMSGSEIAQTLGWNPSTVWSRIYEGCRRLKKKLSPPD